MLDLRITQCILSLGSNYQADHHLALARELLLKNFSQFPELTIIHHYFSPTVSSIDSRLANDTPTGTKITYLNQIAWLTFSQSVLLSGVIEFTKFLENQAERFLYLQPTVTLDIDILIMKAETLTQNHLLSNRSSQIPSLQPLLIPLNLLQKAPSLSTSWYAVSQRLPFAHYDKFGINYLLTHTSLKSSQLLPFI